MFRRLLATCLTAVLALGLTGAPASAATYLEGWTPGNIIADAAFWRPDAMGTSAIAQFIAARGSACVPGPDGTPCLKDYRADTPAMAATAYCPRSISAMTGNNAAQIVADVAYVCGVNPQVLLVLIQKESGLVTASGASLTPSRYARATGMACPDGGSCDASYATFFKQVYRAAEQFNRYRSNPAGYAVKPGQYNQVRYHPNADCGAARVFVANQATAGLYNYTPFTPNAASLAAVVGEGDACSSHGNRNFFRFMKLWFPGSVTTSTAAPVQPSPASPVPAPAWYRFSFAATLFRFDGVTTAPATYDQWRASGFLTPRRMTGFDVVRYPWSPMLYAVSFVTPAERSWAWEQLDPGEWTGAGSPTPRTAGWIAGSTVIQWATGSELFLQERGRPDHHLSWTEWRDTGLRTPVAQANQGFVQCTSGADIYFVPDLRDLSTRRLLSYPEWADRGHPTPLGVTC